MGFGRGRSYPPISPYVYPMPAQIPPQQYTQPTYAYSPMYAPAPQSPEQELTALEGYQNMLVAEKKDLEREMNEVEARIKELKTKPEQGKGQPTGP